MIFLVNPFRGCCCVFPKDVEVTDCIEEVDCHANIQSDSASLHDIAFLEVEKDCFEKKNCFEELAQNKNAKDLDFDEVTYTDP